MTLFWPKSIENAMEISFFGLKFMFYVMRFLKNNSLDRQM